MHGRINAGGEQAETLSVVLDLAARDLRIETGRGRAPRSATCVRFTRIGEGDVALLTQITVAYYPLAR